MTYRTDDTGAAVGGAAGADEPRSPHASSTDQPDVDARGADAS
ncbi:hypothetical protein [Streptomyces sp. NPDC059597]